MINIINLRKEFPIKKGEVVKAVDDVSLNIKKNETLGIVGESSCGKSTLGRTLVGLYEPTHGKVLYKGIDIHRGDAQSKRDIRTHLQMIFQDPYASLNPKMTVGDIIGEGIEASQLNLSRKDRIDKVQELLESMGLKKEHYSRYPHEFSGGQRQRISIARAIAVEPEFLFCDEPISSLDVSVQAQIVNLLISLKEKMNLTYMFVAHDLSMVRYISDRVGVMYLGSIVELAPSRELFQNPLHPYTKALLSAIPSIDIKNPVHKRRIPLAGEVGSALDGQTGCKFAARCKEAKVKCLNNAPELKDVGGSHFLACVL